MNLKNDFNERSLALFQSKIAELYSDYCKKGEQLNYNEINEINPQLASEFEDSGNRLFQELENWAAFCIEDDQVTHLRETVAEYCYDFIEIIIQHALLMRDIYCNDSYSPPKTCYASLQRLLKSHYCADVKVIKRSFEEASLTTYGFDVKTKSEKMKVILSLIAIIISIILVASCVYLGENGSKSYVFGVLVLCLIFITSLFVAKPSGFQYQTYRVILSLGVAGVITLFPGFAEFSIAKTGYNIQSSGSLAIFLIVYLLNPAKLKEMSEK